MINDRLKKHLTGKYTDWLVKNPKRVYITVKPGDIRDIAITCFKEFKLRLCTITGVDNETNFELLYHFSCDTSGEIFNLKVCLEDRKKAELASISDISSSADWVEREIYEMLGIKFLGHPNLKNLLLDTDWPKNNYPLRKKQDA